MNRFEKAAEFGARLGKIAATGSDFTSPYGDEEKLPFSSEPKKKDKKPMKKCSTFRAYLDDRIQYEGKDKPEGEDSRPCPSCGTTKGQVHKPGCDVVKTCGTARSNRFADMHEKDARYGRSAQRLADKGGEVPPGLGLGLGIGGLSGALYGALSPRKDEYYELDERGNIKQDDKGIPKTHFKNRSRLLEAMRRAATGAAIGGGLGLATDAVVFKRP